MKKTINALTTVFVLQFIVITSFSFAQSPNWLWANKATGSSNDFANAITADASGNSYVAGQFSSATFTINSTSLTNTGATDIFIAKYNAGGTMQWAKKAGGSSIDIASAIAVDASGNVYVAGYFNGSTCTFGSTSLTNTQNLYSDIFLVKYNSTGTVQWAKKAGGTSNDMAYGVTVDASGYVYITGSYSSHTCTFGTVTLTNTDTTTADIFLAKYDSNGNVQWAKGAGGTKFDNATSVKVDASGNIFISGYYYSSTISFGTTTLTNAGSTSYADIFLAKYNSSGTVQWAKSVGGTSNDEANAVALDASGNIYLGGWYSSSSLHFDTITLTNPVGYSKIFLTKYNPSGTAVWAKTAKGAGNDRVNGVAIDCSGNPCVAGYFQGDSITFGTSSIVSWGLENIFVTKFDGNGNVLWAKSAGGTSTDYATSIASDASGNAYIAGAFQSPTISLGSINLTNADNTSSTFDAFAAKVVFSVSTTQTNVDCYGGNSGVATVNTSCGSSAYTYLWNTTPAQTTLTAIGLVTGNYTVTVTDLNGSTTTASVAITQTTNINVNNPQVICNGDSYTINGHVYTTAGNYYDTLNSVHGCDSIIKTILTVKPTPPAPVIISNDTVLTSNAATGNQWYRNDTLITGATNQTDSLNGFGNYYDIVTLNGCTSDTSNVIVFTNAGIKETTLNNAVQIYPNPANDYIIIEAPQKAEIEILNIQGQLIKTILSTNSKTKVDVSAMPKGLFIIKLKIGQKIAVKRFVKE